MIQLVFRGCASCVLFYVSDGQGRCAASGRSVPRELVVPSDCPARDGVLVTINEHEVTMSDLIVTRSTL